MSFLGDGSGGSYRLGELATKLVCTRQCAALCLCISVCVGVARLAGVTCISEHKILCPFPFAVTVVATFCVLVSHVANSSFSLHVCVSAALRIIIIIISCCSSTHFSAHSQKFPSAACPLPITPPLLSLMPAPY